MKSKNLVLLGIAGLAGYMLLTKNASASQVTTLDQSPVTTLDQSPVFRPYDSTRNYPVNTKIKVSGVVYSVRGYDGNYIVFNETSPNDNRFSATVFRGSSEISGVI